MLKLATLAMVLLFGANAIPIFSDNTVEDDDIVKINLESLNGTENGSPSEKSGKLLDEWMKDNRNMNADEVSGYAQGDILVPFEKTRNGLRNEATRWPGGVIPYRIDGYYPENVKENIMKAIADYHRLTCLRFVPYTNQPDYISITSKNTGCWSSVGRIGGRQEVNLQSPGCVNMKGTIIHELMHAVGFLHEQSRIIRDKYVTILYQNINPSESHNFDKAREGTTNDFGASYDYRSVMHYSDHAFSNNRQPTIQAKVNNVQMGQREGFSRTDVQKINAMYKCNKKASAVFPWWDAVSTLFRPGDSGWKDDVWTGSS